LLAISGRKALSESLSDLLVMRGDSVVRGTLAQNPGARFSKATYATLVREAERDDSLTEKLGLRQDIPAGLLRDLVTNARSKVRARVLQSVPRDMQESLKAAIATAADQTAVLPPKPVDYTESQRKMAELNRAGKLNDQSINRFAVKREYVNVVTALSFLAAVPVEAIERVIGSTQLDGLIVACKAARLNWSTTMMVIQNRPGRTSASKVQFERGREMFDTMALSTAQQTIRMWSEEKAAQRKRSLG
jgi:uncharacterized protein (DUF2336 family)